MNHLVLIIFLVSLSFSSFAQDTLKSPPKYAISYSPFKIFEGTIQMDYENFQLGNRYSLGGAILASSVIKENINYLEFTQESIGVQINQKLYALSLKEAHNETPNLYLKLGVEYKRTHYSFTDEFWIIEEESPEQYRLKEEEITPYSNRISVIPELGFTFTASHIFIDTHIGLSMFRESIYQNTYDTPLTQNNWAKLNRMNITGGIKIGLYF